MSLLCSPAPTAPDAALSLLLRLDQRGLADHALRVSALSARVCRRLGLTTHPTHVIALAALMHDVGKLAIPRSVLDHPGRLSDRDWALMREHSVIGERTLRRCPALQGLAVLVRHSHERVDGLGYPDGLEGDLIPLGSRIITACDAWDAMTNDRVYQPARSREEAIATLVATAGSQFDIDVVAALVADVSSPRGLK